MVNPSRGRPRLTGSVRQIRLRSSVFTLWNQRKALCGFERATNSEFAEFLLHISTENSLRSPRVLEPDENRDVPLMSSTPVRVHASTSVKRRRIELESPAGESLEVDVTGSSLSSSKQNSHLYPEPCLNSAVGNPFSSFSNDLPQSSDESDTGDDNECRMMLDAFDDNFQFGDRLDSIIECLCGESDKSEDSDSDLEYSLSDDGSDAVDMDITIRDEETTLTMVEDPYLSVREELTSEQHAREQQAQIPVAATQPSKPGSEEDTAQLEYPAASVQSSELPVIVDMDQPLDCVPARTAPQPPEQPSSDVPGLLEQSEEPKDKTVEGNRLQVLRALEKAFTELTSVSDFQDLLELHSRMRVVVSVEKLMELKGTYCSTVVSGIACGTPIQYSAKHIGARVDLEWKCAYGHCGKWESSEVLTTNRYSKVYLNDSLLPIAIVLSGNNYAKFELLCKVLNLSLVSKSNFFSFQTKCAVPVVKDVWSKMRHLVLKILRGYEEICLCGDGRNDSPGHSARYCVYTLMEHVTKVVVDLEVLDKRETGGNSAVMEREGLRRLLERLMNKMPLNELCTDASTTIIKLVRDMKDKFPLLVEMFHSLDIWHKAKKLTKALHQAAKMKGCEELKNWVDPVVNHFWYCCQVAEGSVEELKNTWQGVLHHVCGEHSWTESACKHGPHVEEEKTRKPLSKSSKAMAALRKIVLDPKWLKNLHFYVRFRHTGELENFNSMMTKYAPKRMAFDYPYFIMRILLAAIDHNFHLFRKPKQSPEGELAGHRKYSKRTQRYHAEVVKEEKAYAYFPYMVARMLDTRRGFEGSFSARSDVDEFNPKQIAPTLAMKAPPSTEELMKAPSRFFMKQKETENTQK